MKLNLRMLMKILQKQKFFLAQQTFRRSKYYDKTNNAVLVKMKMSIQSFVGLKGKMYTYITDNEHECKKA